MSALRAIDDTHDPSLRSWVESANSDRTDFPIQNLPFGVFRRPERVDDSTPLAVGAEPVERVEGRGRHRGQAPRIGVAIGDQILDLVRCGEAGLLEGLSAELHEAVKASTLNGLMALGPEAMAQLRPRLTRILSSDGWGADANALVPMAQTELLLPAAIGDYTDFYASIYHATNVGRLFRPDNPLLPNYKHLPIAYHGRSSSIVVSGTIITRPSGQVKPPDAAQPSFGPSERLDYELEVAAFVGAGNALGRPVALEDAERHLFGVCLFNDWSARDIQAWEYQPLGPFLAKNFATTISPWVVTFEALAPFRSPAFRRPAEDPKPLPYLTSPEHDATGGIDITVDVFLRSARMRAEGHAPLRLSRSSFGDMYWTMAQMLAHHTSNGCNLRAGDVLASGTVSGAARGSVGCLLEMTRQGAEPITLPTGESRAFLADGDEVIFRGYCARKGYVKIGFWKCWGMIAMSNEQRATSNQQ